MIDLRRIAASARKFVTQLDAPVLHDRFNRLATACDEAANTIDLLKAEIAILKEKERVTQAMCFDNFTESRNTK